MNSRERVRKILNHEEADRPAIDLGATSCSGTTAWTYRALKEALGIPNGTVQVTDIWQMLAAVEPEVQEALSCDFVMLPKAMMMLGLRGPEWKPWTFWDGQTFDVPEDFNPTVGPDGTLEAEFYPDVAVTMRMPTGCRFFEFPPDPDAEPDYMNLELLPESEWRFQEHMDDEFLRIERDKAKALHASTDKAIVVEIPLSFDPGAPRLASGYGSLYQWAMLMRTEPEHCREYMMRHAEATRQCLDEYLQAIGQYVDVFLISFADFGQQDREAFHPELFKEFFVPPWKLVCDSIHRNHPHIKTMIHCCGSVPNLVPYFVDAGVDILNPVQWTAAGMDLPWLKETFGDKLTFWGGAVSTQRTLPVGTPEDVEREANEVLDVMAPGGGFVVNAIHNILPEVPVENILALYRTAAAYRY
jgi:uroporphyrinogen decarboxylase